MVDLEEKTKIKTVHKMEKKKKLLQIMRLYLIIHGWMNGINIWKILQLMIWCHLRS